MMSKTQIFDGLERALDVWSKGDKLAGADVIAFGGD
jgi:hypothetical protein